MAQCGGAGNVAAVRAAITAAYLRTVVLGAHLERLAAEDREAFVDAVAANLEDRRAEPLVDYVRLNILATRG